MCSNNKKCSACSIKEQKKKEVKRIIESTLKLLNEKKLLKVVESKTLNENFIKTIEDKSGLGYPLTLKTTDDKGFVLQEKSQNRNSIYISSTQAKTLSYLFNKINSTLFKEWEDRKKDKNKTLILPDGSGATSFVMKENDSEKKYYSNIKDIDVPRKRYSMVPKVIGSGSSDVKRWDLYIQDEASQIMIDKYGFEKGYKMWENSINYGGAMYQLASKIVSEKTQMISDLKLRLQDYFERSYLDIWREWIVLKGGKDPYSSVTTEPKQEKKVEVKPTANSTNIQSNSFEDKDAQRIKDIVTKSGGDKTKEIRLAKAMADKITSKQKAIRRAEAAAEIGNIPVEKVFRERAAKL